MEKITTINVPIDLSLYAPSLNILPQETLPLVLLELVSPGFSSNPTYSHLGVKVGYSVEVDMIALSAINETLAVKAFKYYDKCKVFYDNLAAGTPQGAALETERTLICAKQLDTNALRADLKTECSLLTKLPIYGDLVKKILSSNPDFESLALSFKTLGGKFHQDGLLTLVEFSLPGRENWPLPLGGVNSRGELTRIFSLTISHAPWRDRKSRRLVSLSVSTIELWPEA